MSAAPSDIARLPLFRALSPATNEALTACAVERRFRVGELLLEGGARAEWLHVLERGLQIEALAFEGVSVGERAR